MARMGRPPNFATPEELEKAIDKYLKECEKKDKPVLKIGFCVSAGVSRDTISDYAKKPDFCQAIKRLEEACERSLVEGMMTGKWNPSAAIFLAKNNHGYTDKHVNEISGLDGEPLSLSVKFVKTDSD